MRRPARGNVTALRRYSPTDIPLPPGVDAADWMTAGVWGTDGVATYKLTEVTAADDDQADDDQASPVLAQWVKVLDAFVHQHTERSPIPDPDFPDRAEDADDAPEAGGDVTVTVKRGDRVRLKTFRNVKTSDLRACKPLDLFGPTAWRGSRQTQGVKGELFTASNELSEARGKVFADFHVVTGWHHDQDGGRYYVDAGGRITRDGHRDDITVDLGSVLAPYALPAPATGSDLVDALFAVLDLGKASTPRIMLPLIGAVLRAPFGVFRGGAGNADAGVPLPWGSGSTGAGKSGVFSAAYALIAPGVTYKSFPIKAGNSKNGGSSGPGLERMMFKLKDSVICPDDLDPNESAADRKEWQSKFLRAADSQTSRLVANKWGGGTRDAMPCRALAMGNGEPLDGEASATNRAINLPFERGDTTFTQLRDQGSVDARLHRASFTAGVIQELARDWDGHQKRMAAARWHLRALFAAGEVPGPVGRGADSFAELAATWWCVLAMAVDAGLSRHDARNLWEVVKDALHQAWRTHLLIVGAGDRASRFLSYFREAAAAGTVHLGNAQNPKEPPKESGRWGWSWRGNGLNTSNEPRGRLAGWVNDTTGALYLLPSVATGAVRDLARVADDAWSGSTKSVGASLKSEDRLHIAESTRKRGECTDQPKLGDGNRPTVWHVLPGHDDEAEVYRAEDYTSLPDYAAIGAPALDGDDDQDPPDDSPHEPVPPSPTTALPTAPVATVEPVAADSEPPAPAPVRRPASRKAAAAPTPTSPRKPGGRRKAPAMITRTAPSLAVLDVDGVHSTTGLHPRALPTSDAERVALLVEYDVVNLYVTRRAALAMGLPEVVRKGETPVLELAGTGWEAKVSPAMTSWYTLKHPDHKHTRALCIPCYDREQHNHIGGDLDGPTLYGAVALFNKCCPENWYAGRTATARSLLENLFVHTLKLPVCQAIKDKSVPRADKQGWTLVKTPWQRNLTELEDEHLYLNSYDANAGHLNGFNATPLGIGEPVRHEGDTVPKFNKNIAGYWKLAERPDQTSMLLPDLEWPEFADDDLWFTTSEVEFLIRDLKQNVTIVAAVIWPKSSPVMHAWYSRIKNDRKRFLLRHDDIGRIAAKMLSGIMQVTIGMLASEIGDEATYRPDYRDQILSMIRVNRLRHLIEVGKKSGRYPIALSEDAIYYTGTAQGAHDVPEGLRFDPPGEGSAYTVGSYKPERSVALAAVRDHVGEAKLFHAVRRESQRNGGK